ncbi:MAG: peptidase M48, partial [Candidatus Accumulibacter phosphatis]|nr:peptidase M48 [Candidatus Accumulibacter phosphatis]
MEAQQFQALVARVERLAEADPKGYVRRVFAIAALGFVILGLVIAMAMVNVALIGGVVLLVVFSGGKALLFFAKLGKLVIVLAIPVWLMLRTTWTLVFARLPRPEGREIRRDEAAALFARLDAMRERIGGPRVHRVLVTDELNAAIVQRPRLGLLGWQENTLILGLRLLQALSEDEA